jgi:anaerobic selenocysteine-containing dehydrogenase
MLVCGHMPMPHLRTCSLCEALCGLVIEADDGRVRSIRADAEDVLSRGHICPKAIALQDLHEDPDRLRRPMRRRGSSWEEIGRAPTRSCCWG